MSLPLSIAQLQFCHQYCAFIQSGEGPKEDQNLALAFLERRPLPKDTTYPRVWATSDAELGKASAEFFSLVEGLLQSPMEQSRAMVFWTRKAKGFFFQLFIVFLLFFALKRLGVEAAPHPGSLSYNIARSSSAHDRHMFHRGHHFDNATGHHFELYVFDETMTNSSAFELYASGCEETSLAKRDWYDCNFPNANYIQKFCCNTGHGLGGIIGATGATVAGIYLEKLLEKAINGSRDNQKPRSVCLAEDGNNLCVSWASYSTDIVVAGEESDIVKYSIECAKSNGSAEFKTVTGDGGILFICVSNRADGCGMNVG